MASIFCNDKLKISSTVTGFSFALQIPVEILTFLPSFIAAAIFLTVVIVLAALELAPSLFLPLIMADATPSIAICPAVLPNSSSMAARESILEPIFSDPIAASLRNTSNSLSRFEQVMRSTTSHFDPSLSSNSSNRRNSFITTSSSTDNILRHHGVKSFELSSNWTKLFKPPLLSTAVHHLFYDLARN
ncbi:hypothetical protein C4D60_Mb05t06210 [Musa balbisiana]|uniref:Uncharacterized protein n=1 Tax=Musa balbisiana TaxID=52838 RepID=A0A4S8JU22_MUSBA|nr:hypothetical protein C4D60_Mb05t06210 [Musa balbisiana]